MKVIAAINGSIAAESMAFYALKYAQIQNLTFVLLHVKNKKDNLDDVEASIRRITTFADTLDVKTEAVLLQGAAKESVRNFLSNIYVDTIFCSTRKRKNFILHSFSELLTKMKLNVDIAVVRIVNISDIMDVDNITLSIKEDRLSVKKFTFFAVLASAYRADGKIYSVSSMTRHELSKVDMYKARERLSFINHNLKHYTKLANLMTFTLHIKHDFTTDEAESILTHIAKSDTKLLVIGAKRLSMTSFFKREIPIERLMRDASINTIAYYSSED